MIMVKVLRIIEGPVDEKPFDSHGKTLQPVAWMADIEEAGVKKSGVKLRTLSAKTHWIVQPGNTIACDGTKEYKGVIEYKITTPSDGNNHINAKPKEGATTTPQTQAQSKPVTAGESLYTMEEYEKLFIHAWNFVTDSFSGLTPEGIASLTSTFIIGANRFGLKASNSKPSTMNPAMQDALSKQIDSALEKADLLDRTVEAEVTQDILLKWWNEASGNVATFTSRVNQELIDAGQ